MCPSPAGSSSDLTTAARIRNAAMVRFAKDGLGAGLRAIAADAGVTAGLITHHFGSKEGLRQACDEEVLRITVEAKTASEVLGGPVNLLTQMAQTEEYVPATAYTLRSLMEGGPLAASLLDSLVADSADYMGAGVAAGYISPTADELERSRYLVYSGLGALVFFARYKASDPADVEAVVREFLEWSGPVAAELYSAPLVTNPEALTAYAQAARAVQGSSGPGGSGQAGQAGQAGKAGKAGQQPPEQPEGAGEA